MTPAARIALEIQACENGTVEAPLWEYLLGWADWQKEKTLLEMEEYRKFLDGKRPRHHPFGFENIPSLNPSLFDFQRDLTKWALRLGRASIWCDCGLGKTFVNQEWLANILSPIPTTQLSRQIAVMLRIPIGENLGSGIDSPVSPDR